MKSFKTIFLMLLASIILSACASSVKRPMDEKYIFPDLEEVKHIRSYTIDGWGEIDKQSLFVSVSPSTSYLIILKQPNHDLAFAHAIQFRSSSNTVYAKFDSIDIINIQDNINPLPAYIDRIYKVKGKEQKKLVRAKILGEQIENAKTEAEAEANN